MRRLKGKAPANDGMHPTADAPPLILRQRCGGGGVMPGVRPLGRECRQHGLAAAGAP